MAHDINYDEHGTVPHNSACPRTTILLHTNSDRLYDAPHTQLICRAIFVGDRTFEGTFHRPRLQSLHRVSYLHICSIRTSLGLILQICSFIFPPFSHPFRIRFTCRLLYRPSWFTA